MEPKIVELSVADVECFGGEGVRLYFDVGSADAVNEAGFSDVGVACEEDGPLIGVDGGQPSHMFPDFLEVGEGGCYFPDHGAHPSKCCSFEGFAPVE